MRTLGFICIASFLLTLGGCLPENTLPEPRPAEEEPDVEFNAAPAAAPETSATAELESSSDAKSTEPVASTPAPVEQPPAKSTPEEKTPTKSRVDELAEKPLRIRPKEPLSVEERRARTSKNLYQISSALAVSLFKNKEFPTDIVDRAGKPLLSWRVRLLPLLGYEELTDQFRMNEPWDSPHNLTLLSAIPPCYQSPERFDGRTNYLAPDGPTTALQVSRDAKLYYPADGFSQTILVVEADDELAVPWTRPADLPFDPKAPRAGLGKLREDGFFAVLGSAKAHVITSDLNDSTVASLFAVFKEGEAAKNAKPTRTLLESGYSAPTDVQPLQPLALEGGRREPPGSSAASRTGSSSTGVTFSPDGSGDPSAAPDVPKYAVPDEAAQEAVREDMRALFQTRYKEAKTSQERLKIATELVQHAANLGDDSVGRYVMLRAALEIAAANGDIRTARDAADELLKLFHIDSPSFQLETIQTAARSLSKDEKGRLELAKWAKEACDDAYAKDNYAAARELYQIALSLARAANDRDLLREVMSRFTGIENARREYAQIAKVIESLEAEPDDPQKNLLVGRYFCFVKEDWVQGLTFLAKGPDRRLAELAADDQALPIDPLDQVKLGDAWWSVAEDYADQQQKAIQRRSAWWYRQAVDNLPGGLAKVKAEIRLKELEKTSIQKSDRTPLLFGRDE